MGRAIMEFAKTGKADTLRVLSSMFDEDEIDVPYLFRTVCDMPETERTALSLAEGRVLDVGAGAGCHTLALQGSNRVTAIDISPQSVEAMTMRGVKDARCIDVFDTSLNEQFDTILLLMGHGTEHAANDIYIRLAQKMRKLPMRLCTVEGTPSFDDAIEELTAQPQRKVQLAPMLFVAGDHAKNDMAGDEPDSLRSMLKAKVYAVSCAIQGLGELADIRNMYVEKAREAFV